MTLYVVSKFARSITLGVLTLVIALSNLDRFVLAILIEPIRAEFSISDTHMGLLIGSGFALFYCSAAIPIARLAERYNRIAILIIAVLVWSTATTATGFTTGFATLLAARMLVGCGEAGGLAPALAVVADIYPIERRSSAMATIGMGVAGGSALAPWLGGWLASIGGWRIAFVLIGALGVPLALMLRLFVQEPPRGLADHVRSSEVAVPLSVTVRGLLRRPTFVLLIMASIPMALAQGSVALWLPSLLRRAFGVGVAQLGLHLLWCQGIPLLIGTYFGGAVTDNLSRRDSRWMVGVPMISQIVAVPAVLGLCTAHAEASALAYVAVLAFATGLFIGPCYALFQSLAAVHSRATAMSVAVFCVVLVGMGAGPPLMGLLSDLLGSRFGKLSLGYAFYALIPLHVVAALILGIMSFRLQVDLEDARRDSNCSAMQPLLA